MAGYDFVFRNAALPGGLGDVAVVHGRTAAIGMVPGSGAEELDARGAFLLPGGIDAHVHFNEPGRTEWEGLETGSRALAAGGGTMFFDMPLNSHPPVLDAEAFARKRAAAERHSVLDFALWGGLCPGSIDQMDEMADAGAVAFKAFMCPSGIEEFPYADPRTLRQGMRRAAARGIPVGVHAEWPDAILPAGDDRSMRGFIETRPKAVELEAVRIACEIAGETGARLHVVHCTCAEVLAVIAASRAAGADVTAETCPNYLCFTDEDACRIGALAKCAPPMRTRDDVQALWAALARGEVATVGSDHSPSPPEMNLNDDLFVSWGGISGCQHAFPAFLAAWHARKLGTLHEAATRFTDAVADRFRLPGDKRAWMIGADADLVLWRFREPAPVDVASLLYRHPISLYEGFQVPLEPAWVMRRGEWLVLDGVPVPEPSPGQFLRPRPS